MITFQSRFIRSPRALKGTNRRCNKLFEVVSGCQTHVCCDDALCGARLRQNFLERFRLLDLLLCACTEQPVHLQDAQVLGESGLADRSCETGAWARIAKPSVQWTFSHSMRACKRCGPGRLSKMCSRGMRAPAPSPLSRSRTFLSLQRLLSTRARDRKTVSRFPARGKQASGRRAHRPPRT